MKEYTLVCVAEITKVIKSDYPLYYNNPNAIANWIGSKLNVDDVHVKSVKFFKREVEE